MPLQVRGLSVKHCSDAIIERLFLPQERPRAQRQQQQQAPEQLEALWSGLCELGGDNAALQERIAEAWLRLGLRRDVDDMVPQALPAPPPAPSTPPPPSVTPPLEEVDETDARCILCLSAPACIGVVHDLSGLVHRLACRECWEPRLVLDRRCPVCREQFDAVVRVI